jgi:D-3-phosphoglycerate dehydrogenase / 2-oxoglutarate reductase
MIILAVGDSYMAASYFRDAFEGLGADHRVEYFDVDADRSFHPTSASECSLREFQGSPAELTEHMGGVEVLVVHGAPVTDAVLDASSELRLVCCARGGPVNVDVDAVKARGLPLVTTPGKNAEAVADQTLAFLVMLARGFPKAQRFIDRGGRVIDNWAGATFLGNDLRGHTLGLVGFGRIGRRVAKRSLSFGMHVLAFDPFWGDGADGQVERVNELDELLARADFVSVHARASAENENLFGAAQFARMKPGAFFVNTARETLVDEDALDEALGSGHLGGAALDVIRLSPHAARHRLLRHENVVITPHIGGATHETLIQGAEMIAMEITRFASGEPLVNAVTRGRVRS